MAVDTHGSILFANAAAVDMIAFVDAQIPLEDWTNFYGFYLSDGVTPFPAADSPMLRAAAGEEAQDVEVCIQNRAGRVYWCSIDFKPLIGLSGELSGALLVLRDTSEQRKLATEAARSNAALQQFATVAAHDLQEPLRSISGFADMLAEYQADQLDQRSTRCLTKIKEGIVRMQALINDLLSYSRIQTKPQLFKSTNCNEILKNCINSLEASITEHEAKVLVAQLPNLMADNAQMTQLFQNLVGNALKFSASDRLPVVKIEAKRQAKFWLFSVEDNGIGIEPEFCERVFRVFQRLHTTAAYPGTGIGLAICQTIVDRHGGRIWVESKAGEGSTFKFTIPAGGENPCNS